MYVIDKERVVWGEMEGETLLLDLVSGFYFSFDEIGGLVWERLCDGQCEEDIVKGIVEEYSVDEATCRADIRELLQQLEEAELVEIESKEVPYG